MKIYTIGFTKQTAAEFFEKLKKAGIKKLIDVRLNNSSQLSAFAKKDDLKYFLREICGAEYVHAPLLAPTQGMLDEYKKHKGSWTEYSARFTELITVRKIEAAFDRTMFETPSVLLCSEHDAEYCHRRLVVDYLQKHWGDIEVIHL